MYCRVARGRATIDSLQQRSLTQHLRGRFLDTYQWEGRISSKLFCITKIIRKENSNKN